MPLDYYIVSVSAEVPLGQSGVVDRMRAYEYNPGSRQEEIVVQVLSNPFYMSGEEVKEFIHHIKKKKGSTTLPRCQV